MKKIFFLLLFLTLATVSACGSKYNPSNPESFVKEAMEGLHQKKSYEGKYQLTKSYSVKGKDYFEKVTLDSKIIRKGYQSIMEKSVETNDPFIQKRLLDQKIIVYTKQSKEDKDGFHQILEINGERKEKEIDSIKLNGLTPIIEDARDAEIILWDGILYRPEKYRGKEETVLIDGQECYEIIVDSKIIPRYTVFLGNIDWKSDLVESIVYPYPELQADRPLEWKIYIDRQEKIPVKIEANYINNVEKTIDGKVQLVEEKQQLIVEYKNVDAVKTIDLP